MQISDSDLDFIANALRTASETYRVLAHKPEIGRLRDQFNRQADDALALAVKIEQRDDDSRD